MASKGRLSRSSAVCLLSSNAYASDASLSKGVYRIFRSPNGYVYASNGEGLFELASRPTVRARLVHGPIRWKQVQSYFELGLSVSPIQAVGRDGSLWASTPTQVIHVHPDGTMHAMRFVEPPNRITMPLQAIPLTMTRDGAVWAWGKTIRIDNSDRIQVLTLPQQDEVGQLRFGSDSSLWLIIRDARNDRPLGVVNVVPAVLARHATAWPFKVPARAGSPTPCPFPTTPPTPVPPLPPKGGAVNFVYVAGGPPDGVWGYWAGRNGKLTPVRGAPFRAGEGPRKYHDRSGWAPSLRWHVVRRHIRVRDRRAQWNLSRDTWLAIRCRHGPNDRGHRS